MARHSPTRFLAPLALVAACVTIYLVTESELGDSSSTTTATTSSAKASGAKPTTSARKAKAKKRAPRKTYTVKPGDVLSSISETTGVAVADLLKYNDLEDAQNLSVGQKLKLKP